MYVCQHSGQTIGKGGVSYESYRSLPHDSGFLCHTLYRSQANRAQTDVTTGFFFDYITGITIGSIAAEMATELENPWKPFTAILIYAGVTLLLSIVTNKYPRTRRYLYGSPTILMDRGKLYRGNLKKPSLI